MSNPIKYSTGSESLALKKGNFYIGTGDVGKGPTSTTGYYNGITPPSGGYTIYLNKVTGGPSIYTCANDTELISLTNSIAGTSYTTANECFVYFAGQSDKMVLNRDYEGIVTDGLVLNLDAGFTPSYPRSGTTWYDVSDTNNGTLTNGPTFNSGNGGGIVFDGTNDYVTQPYDLRGSTDFSIEVWAKNDYPRGEVTYNNLALGGVGGAGGSYLRFTVYSTLNTAPGGVLFWAQGPQTFSSSNFPINFDINGWHCYTFTRTTTFQRIYTDGSLLAATTFNNTASITSNYNNIGRYATSYHWDGIISNYKIYNRALTSDEILQNYNAQKGRFGL